MTTALDKNEIDVAQAFQTYIAFQGNSAKTAIACNLDVATVEALAKAERWQSKIKQWTEITDGDVKSVQIQVNRAVSLVQGMRLRALIDKVVQVLSEDNAEALVARLTNEKGEFKSRSLTDLTKASESANLICARALGDTAEERPQEKEGKHSSIALSVLAALNAVENVGLDSVEVVKRQLAAPNDDTRNNPAAS